MATANATELPLTLFLGDRIVELDSIVAALSGSLALIFATEESNRVEEIVRAARIVRDQLDRVKGIREQIDAYDVAAVREAFEMTMQEH
jgi:hypothetical protein